jgi:hypothetical protein
VRLTWRTGTPLTVELDQIFGGGHYTVIATFGENAREYTTSTGDTGRAEYTYALRDLDTGNWSNQVTVTFPR